MSFKCTTGWKSISMHEAKARAGSTKRGMTDEEEGALKPLLEPLSPRVASKTGKLPRSQQKRYERAIEVEKWAKDINRPFTFREGALFHKMSESLFRDTANLCRIKKRELAHAPGQRGHRQWLYVFDLSTPVLDPNTVIRKYGVQ